MKQRESVRRLAERRQIADLVARDQRYTIFSEFWQSRRTGRGFAIDRIREYAPGDDPDDLDRDDLVRGEESIIVRKAQEAPTLLLFVDVSPSALAYYAERGEFSQKSLIIDAAVSMLVYTSYGRKGPVGLVLFSDRIEEVFLPQAGEYVRYVLDGYFEYEPKEARSTNLACILPEITRFEDSIICVISDFQHQGREEEAIDFFSQCSAMDVNAIVVRDPCENIEVRGRGYVFCRDPETGEEWAEHVTKKTWTMYSQDAKRFYSRLGEELDRMRILYTSLTTPDMDECHANLQDLFARRYAMI